MPTGLERLSDYLGDGMNMHCSFYRWSVFLVCVYVGPEIFLFSSHWRNGNYVAFKMVIMNEWNSEQPLFIVLSE